MNKTAVNDFMLSPRREDDFNSSYQKTDRTSNEKDNQKDAVYLTGSTNPLSENIFNVKFELRSIFGKLGIFELL